MQPLSSLSNVIALQPARPAQVAAGHGSGRFLGENPGALFYRSSKAIPGDGAGGQERDSL
jgi:hypothetical protein